MGKFLKMKQQARVHCGVSDTPDWLSVGLKSQGFRQEELHTKQVLCFLIQPQGTECQILFRTPKIHTLILLSSWGASGSKDVWTVPERTAHESACAENLPPANEGFQWTDALFVSLWGTAAPLPFTRGNHAGISDSEARMSEARINTP